MSESEYEKMGQETTVRFGRHIPSTIYGTTSQIRSVVYSIDSCPHRVQNAR
jgi:hypothetical protein